MVILVCFHILFFRANKKNGLKILSRDPKHILPRDCHQLKVIRIIFTIGKRFRKKKNFLKTRTEFLIIRTTHGSFFFFLNIQVHSPWKQKTETDTKKASTVSRQIMKLFSFFFSNLLLLLGSRTVTNSSQILTL